MEGWLWQRDLGHSVLSLGQFGSLGLGRLLPSAPFWARARAASSVSHPVLTRPHSSCSLFSGQVINNYLDTNETVSSGARVSRMHFYDNQRKVDYVLAYHYRKRGAHPGQGVPGQSLAIVSNGETGKEPPAGGSHDIELGRLDTLEEERREQRDEFEHNLMEAGLELEKDLEVRLDRSHRAVGWDGPAGLGS